MKIESLEQACAAAWRGAYRGLRSQGWQRAADYPFGCVWRSKDWTRCCAVGWLIPNGNLRARGDRVGAAVEGDSDDAGPLLAEPLRAWRSAARMDDREAFDRFLETLQNAHDSHEVPSAMHTAFDAIGRVRGWETPS